MRRETQAARQQDAPRPSGSSGLVLLELLAAVAVLAVLVALATPSFTTLVERMRLRVTTYALRDSLYLARAEAIKRGGHVVLARIPNQGDCDASAEGAWRWRCGWAIFMDVDGDGRESAGDDVLLSAAGQPSIDVDQNNKRDRLPLNAWGQFKSTTGVGFQLRSRLRRDVVSAICISAGGRIQTWIGEERCPG